MSSRKCKKSCSGGPTRTSSPLLWETCFHRKAAADGQKLDIKTYQVLASKEYGLYQEVHLRFNLMTNVDGLHYFLARVKNSQFAILVQEINIQKIQRNKGPDLVVNVILAALMEKGEKSVT